MYIKKQILYKNILNIQHIFQARAWGLQMGGARFLGNRSQQVKSACTADFFTTNGVKFTVSELVTNIKVHVQLIS